ncbi:hypothetical protein DMN69_09440, partial [Campylobacter jejuni]|nr:hypothetical protein [Campylobacter jejuni]
FPIITIKGFKIIFASCIGPKFLIIIFCIKYYLIKIFTIISYKNKENVFDINYNFCFVGF